MEDGASFKKAEYRNLVFDMGQKCSEYPERKNSKFSNVLNIQNTKCVYKGDNIFWESKNLVFDIGLKCTEKIVSKNFKKMKCTEKIGTRNVSIRGRIPQHKNVRYLIQMYI